jgi:hypothetical protein
MVWLVWLVWYLSESYLPELARLTCWYELIEWLSVTPTEFLIFGKWSAGCAAFYRIPCIEHYLWPRVCWYMQSQWYTYCYHKEQRAVRVFVRCERSMLARPCLSQSWFTTWGWSLQSLYRGFPLDNRFALTCNTPVVFSVPTSSYSLTAELDIHPRSPNVKFQSCSECKM